MDIDRNKINEMKSECLQMPDYIRGYDRGDGRTAVEEKTALR